MLRERQGRERLDGVAQDVEAARRCDLRRHRLRVLRIEQPERRLQAATRDAGLGVEPGKVEDADAGRLASRASGRWNRDERSEGSGHRKPLPDRRVHVVQEIRRRVRGVEVGGLGGVDRGPAAYRDERIVGVPAGKRDGVEKGLVRWLHAHAVEQRERDAAGLERLEDRLHGGQTRHGRVAHDEDLGGAEVREV